MAAGGSSEFWPGDGGQVGPVRPKFVRAPSVTENVAMAGSDRSGAVA